MQPLPLDAPHQRFGLIIKAVAQALKHGMKATIVRGLRAHQCIYIELQTGARPPIDLSAGFAPLIDDRYGDAMRRKHVCGCNPGRASSNNCDLHNFGNPGGAVESTCIPSATTVVQARTREWSASHTQQSWHAPIRQKPARISPLNS